MWTSISGGSKSRVYSNGPQMGKIRGTHACDLGSNLTALAGFGEVRLAGGKQNEGKINWGLVHTRAFAS